LIGSTPGDTIHVMKTLSKSSHKNLYKRSAYERDRRSLARPIALYASNPSDGASWVKEKARTTILIVENDVLSALNVRETLEAAGYATLSTGTGEDAVRLASDSSVGLVLMDISLDGELDGIDAAEAILRASSRPIVFMSSHDDAATMIRLERVDAYGFMPKPFGNASLLATVSMALRRSAAERSAADRMVADYERRLLQSDTRLKESHHRIRNDIAAISSILSLQLGEAEHPETVEALSDALGRVESLSTLYEMLTVHDSGGDIEVRPYLERLIGAIMPIFPGGSGIDVDCRVDEFMLDQKRTFTLGIIVNELLTNALKYAFDGRSEGSIRLDVCVYDESVIMTMRDDGKGLPERFDIAESSGLGLTLISMLLDQFDGTLTMRSDHGTVSTALIKAPGLEATAPAAPAGLEAAIVAKRARVNVA